LLNTVYFFTADELTSWLCCLWQRMYVS